MPIAHARPLLARAPRNRHRGQPSVAADGTARVSLFGGPQLLLGDRQVALSHHQACLLALVYGSDRGIARAEAAWLLWESDDTRAARHRISQLVYGIGKRAGVVCFDSAPGPSLQGMLVSDLSDFYRSIELKRLLGLRSAAEQSFLSRLDPPTAAYAHWIDAKRATVRRDLRALAATVMTDSESGGDWDGVSAAAGILLEIDPWDESILRRMLGTCALRRSRMELEAILRSHAERLRVLTGDTWQPERQTLDLLARIEEAREETPKKAPPLPPLTGRTREFRLLHERLSAPVSTVQFTVVAGDAGIGKTRLIRDVLTGLRVTGHLVLESRSSPIHRDLPFHSLLGALSNQKLLNVLDDLHEPWRSALTVIFPDISTHISQPPPGLDPQATARRLMEALYQLLTRACAQAPMVLFLDDLQWLDRTTLSALEFVADRTPAPPLQVVLALRDDSSVDSSVKAFTHQVGRTGAWIQLDELDAASADALVASAAPQPLSKAERERLCNAAGRNPFFLIELANDYCSREAERSPSDPGEHIPSSIRQLIAGRLDDLSAESRTLLQLLSVVGSLQVDAPIPLEELRSGRLPDIADALVHARLIQHDAGTISIRHELIRQTAYDLIGPVKRATLHRRAAEAALQRGESGAGEAAVHFDRAGARPQAFRHATQAAEAAQEHGAVAAAIRFWEMARRNASQAEEMESATRQLAELLYHARRLEEAIPLLESVRVSANEDEAARYGLMRLDALSELPGAPQDIYLSEVTDIIEQAAAVNGWTAYAEGVEIQLRILERLNRERDIAHHLVRVRQVYESGHALSPYVLCLLNCVLALSVLYHDDERGLLSAEEAVRLAREYEIEHLLLRAHNRKLYCYLLRGELHTPAGVAATQEALAVVDRSGDLKSKATIYNNVGCYRLDTGDYEGAARFFRSAEALACGASERSMVFCNWGELNYYLGHYDIAEAYFTKAQVEAERQPIFGFLSSFISAGIGLCALATGRLSLARSLEDSIQGVLGTWIHDPHLLVRFLSEIERRRGRIQEAVQLLRERAMLEKRRPVYWIRTRLLEAKYLRLIDREAGDQLLTEVGREATDRGLARMLTV